MNYKTPYNLLKLAKHKGLRYTYNTVHFYVFWTWIRNHPRLINLLNKISPYPSYIEIEITTRCDLKCIMCEHTFWNEKPRDMTFNEFKTLMDQFPKLKWIAMTGIGEDFLNKDFLDMYRYVKKQHPGILIELYDAFHRVTEDISHELVEDIGLTQVFFSFDASTKETYEKIRVGANFDTVLNNIKNFIRIRNEFGIGLPKVGFHFIIMKENIHEVLPYIKLVKKLGGDHIFFTQMLHSFKEVNHLVTEVPERLINQANELGTFYGVEIDWNMDTTAEKPAIRNCIEWTTPFVYATGHVLPCCCIQEANNRSFFKENCLGNVFEQPFKEIWNSAKYKVLRKQIQWNEIPLLCKDCPIYKVKFKTVIFEKKYDTNIDNFSCTEELDKFIEKKEGKKLKVINK